MRKFIVLLAIFIGASSLSGALAQVRLGGYLKFYHHNNTVSPHRIAKTGVRLQMNLQKSFGERGELFSSFDFDANDLRLYQNGLNRRGNALDIYPVEAYVSLYFSNVDVRLGKQFIFWGKTDWINPTDNLNPWDYANISSEIEDYRLPVTAVKTDWYLGPVTLEADWLPVFLPDRLPVKTGRIRPGDAARHIPAIYQASPVLPAPTLKHSQAALRLSHTVWGIDYSVSYYAGLSHQFSMISRFDPVQNQITLTPTYKPLHVVGGDFQRIFGSWGIKGEGAYFRTADPRRRDPEIENPHFKYVLGSDWTPGDRVALTLQWVQDIHEADAPKHTQNGSTQMATVSHSPDRVASSVSAVLRWNPFDYVTSQVIGVLNLKDKDSFVLGFVSYELADALHITAGGLFFSGPVDSPFGQMDKEDKVFLEVKYSY